LIIEVGRSSKARDRGPKMALFGRAGVRKYLTFAVEEKELVWRELIDGQYHPLKSDEDGILRSGVFPGLWLDAAALIAGDGNRLMEVLRQGVASPGHASFVSSLAVR
jgi:hypothetical protein